MNPVQSRFQNLNQSPQILAQRFDRFHRLSPRHHWLQWKRRHFLYGAYHQFPISEGRHHPVKQE